MSAHVFHPTFDDVFHVMFNSEQDTVAEDEERVFALMDSHVARCEGDVRRLYTATSRSLLRNNKTMTLLQLAAQKGFYRVVQRIVDRYVHTVHLTMHDGVTALWLAVMENDDAGALLMVSYLHGRGASLTARRNNGANALYLACERGLLMTARYVHEHTRRLVRADTRSHMNWCRNTPLHTACAHGRLGVCSWLLSEQCADMWPDSSREAFACMKNYSGCTAMDLALIAKPHPQWEAFELVARRLQLSARKVVHEVAPWYCAYVVRQYQYVSYASAVPTHAWELHPWTQQMARAAGVHRDGAPAPVTLLGAYMDVVVRLLHYASGAGDFSPALLCSALLSLVLTWPSTMCAGLYAHRSAAGVVSDHVLHVRDVAPFLLSRLFARLPGSGADGACCAADRLSCMRAAVAQEFASLQARNEAENTFTAEAFCTLSQLGWIAYTWPMLNCALACVYDEDTVARALDSLVGPCSVTLTRGPLRDSSGAMRRLLVRDGEQGQAKGRVVLEAFAHGEDMAHSWNARPAASQQPGADADADAGATGRCACCCPRRAGAQPDERAHGLRALFVESLNRGWRRVLRELAHRSVLCRHLAAQVYTHHLTAQHHWWTEVMTQYMLCYERVARADARAGGLMYRACPSPCAEEVLLHCLHGEARTAHAVARTLLAPSAAWHCELTPHKWSVLVWHTPLSLCACLLMLYRTRTRRTPPSLFVSCKRAVVDTWTARRMFARAGTLFAVPVACASAAAERAHLLPVPAQRLICFFVTGCVAARL